MRRFLVFIIGFLTIREGDSFQLNGNTRDLFSICFRVSGNETSHSLLAVYGNWVEHFSIVIDENSLLSVESPDNGTLVKSAYPLPVDKNETQVFLHYYVVGDDTAFLGLSVFIQGNYHDFRAKVWKHSPLVGHLDVVGGLHTSHMEISPSIVTFESFQDPSKEVDGCGQQIMLDALPISATVNTLAVPSMSVLGTYALSFSVQILSNTGQMNRRNLLLEVLHKDLSGGFGVALSGSRVLFVYDVASKETIVQGKVVLPADNAQVEIMIWVQLVPDGIVLTVIVGRGGKVLDTMSMHTTGTGLLGLSFIGINSNTRLRPAAAKIANIILRKKPIHSLTEAVGLLATCQRGAKALLVQSNECTGLFEMPGICTGFSNATIELCGLLSDNFGRSSNAWLKDVLRPMLDALQHAFTSNGAAYMGSNVCAGSFKGTDITNSPSAGPLSQLFNDGCINFPLNPTSEYTVFSTTLPGSLALPLCPEIEATHPMFAKQSISFCIAASVCDGDLPTFGITLNKNLMACILDNPEIDVGSEGLTLLLSEAVELSVDALAFAVSASADLQQHVTIFDGDKKTSAIVPANLATTELISLNSSKIGLPGILTLSVTAIQLISVVEEEASFVQDIQKQNATHTVEQLTAGFTMGFSGAIILTFGLNTITHGAFPDIYISLGNGTALVTDAPKEVTHVEKGFYVFAQAKDLAASVIRGVVTGLLPLLANMIDRIFGSGATKQLITHLSPSNGGDTLFGIAVNDDLSSLMLRFPMLDALKTIPPFSTFPIPSDFLGSLGIHLKVDHKTGSFSLKVDYIKGGFITAMLDAEKWVIREAKEFFDESGKIISIVLHSFVSEIEEAEDCVAHFFAPGSKCYIFNNYFIQKTAQFLSTVEDDIDKDIKDWAHDAVNWCGTQWVVDGLECGFEEMKNGLFCGLETITSAADCSTEYVVDAALCGEEYVVDGAKCGWKVVKDAGECGVETVTNGILCGVHSVADWIDHLFGGGSSSKPNTCSVPASCRISERCQVPKGCNVALSCQVPKICKVPLGCNMPKNC
mmetsp:Transcript_45206/g.72488  ORF Transcript_45206/g.72488 Transcript_45206/m.72488 type:complete len:1040 (+) Transcript_45206:2793-5912(+)